jgi:hypothetical protein
MARHRRVHGRPGVLVRRAVQAPEDVMAVVRLDHVHRLAGTEALLAADGHHQVARLAR